MGIHVVPGAGISNTASYTQSSFQIADSTYGAIQGYFIADSMQPSCSINFTNSTSAAFYRYPPVSCDAKGNCLLKNQMNTKSATVGKMGHWGKHRAVCTKSGQCDLVDKSVNPAFLL